MKPDIDTRRGAQLLFESTLPDGVEYGIYHVPYETEFQKDMVVMHMDWSGLSWSLICVQTVSSLSAGGIFDVRFPDMTARGEAYILVESPLYVGESSHRGRILAKNGEPVKVRDGDGLRALLEESGYCPRKHEYSDWYMLSTGWLESGGGNMMWTEMARIARMHTERCTKTLLHLARRSDMARKIVWGKDWRYCGSDDTRYFLRKMNETE